MTSYSSSVSFPGLSRTLSGMRLPYIVKEPATSGTHVLKFHRGPRYPDRHLVTRRQCSCVKLSRIWTQATNDWNVSRTCKKALERSCSPVQRSPLVRLTM